MGPDVTRNARCQPFEQRIASWKGGQVFAQLSRQSSDELVGDSPVDHGCCA